MAWYAPRGGPKVLTSGLEKKWLLNRRSERERERERVERANERIMAERREHTAPYPTSASKRLQKKKDFVTCILPAPRVGVSPKLNGFRKSTADLTHLA